jgi:hypothetical protein
MQALIKYARNELVFGTHGQQSPTATYSSKKPSSLGSMIGRLAGATVGYSIPVGLDLLRSKKSIGEINPVNLIKAQKVAVTADAFKKIEEWIDA